LKEDFEVLLPRLSTDSGDEHRVFFKEEAF